MYSDIRSLEGKDGFAVRRVRVLVIRRDMSDEIRGVTNDSPLYLLRGEMGEHLRANRTCV